MLFYLYIFVTYQGTVLFFDDEKDLHELQDKFAMYKDHVPSWADQANVMIAFSDSFDYPLARVL